MSTKAWLAIIILLAVIIIVMTFFLFATPVAAPTLNGAQATSTNEATLPSPAQ